MKRIDAGEKCLYHSGNIWKTGIIINVSRINKENIYTIVGTENWSGEMLDVRGEGSVLSVSYKRGMLK